LTGVPPAVHGIQRNQVWDFSSIKVPTLWDDLRAAGKTSAEITWPVTVGAPITWNRLEYTDELIGQMVASLPRDTVLVLLSDHGFVSVEKTVHPPVGKVTPFMVTAFDAAEASELARLSEDPANGIGRPIPSSEWARFMPGSPTPVAAYEPADLFLFSPTPPDGRYGKPYEIGTHGLWPGRPAYRSVFLLWGPGIHPEKLPEMSQLDIYPRLKSLLAVP
jgi:hypothetical protein